MDADGNIFSCDAFFCDLTKARNDRPTVYDAGPALDRHWVDVSCLLGVLVHNIGEVTKADLGSVSSALEP